MQSTLRVRLVRAENLPAADSNGFSDPYAVLRLDGQQKKKSETIYKTLDPDWSQDFLFDEKLGELGHLLMIEVWDRDTLSSDFLGRGQVEVDTLAVGEKKEFAIELSHPARSGPRGTVHITVKRTKDSKDAAAAQEREIAVKESSGLGLGSMLKAVGGGMRNAISKAAQLHPQGGKGVQRMVTVDVISARGVPPMDYNGSADCYLKMKVGRKLRRTTTQFHNLSPEWRERFVFVLFDMGGRDSNIAKFELWDKDTIGSDDKVSTLEVDLSALPLNLTEERWWKMKKYTTKSFFGFGPSKGTENPPADPEILMLITVADLFEPQLPPDQLALAQKASQGWLRVHVLKADNLPAMDSNGFSDPFVVIEVGNRHMRTHTVKKSLDPEWNTVVETPLKDVFECIYVHVLDEDDNGKFDEIGSLCIPIMSIKNGIAKWYQLKDPSSLQVPVQGCIKLAFHLNYLTLPMMAKCISRRAPKYMARPEEFKFKVLKANIARLQVFGVAGLEGATMLYKAMTWQINEQVTVGFLVGWILFWHFVQLWHLVFGLCLVTLALGMQKFRGRISQTNTFDEDAYIEDGQEPAEEAEAGDEPDEGDDGEKKSSSVLKNPLAFREQMRQMRIIARTLQNLLGEVASMMERVQNLFAWASPALTAIFCLALLVGTALLIFIPIRYFVMAWGVNKVVRTGLRKYHPAFKRGPYYKPIIEVLEFLGRVPDNVEVAQRKEAPLPEHLIPDQNVKIKTD